jgi:hypothetical protein
VQVPDPKAGKPAERFECDVALAADYDQAREPVRGTGIPAGAPVSTGTILDHEVLAVDPDPDSEAAGYADVAASDPCRKGGATVVAHTD